MGPGFIAYSKICLKTQSTNGADIMDELQANKKVNGNDIFMNRFMNHFFDLFTISDLTFDEFVAGYNKYIDDNKLPQKNKIQLGQPKNQYPDGYEPTLGDLLSDGIKRQH